MSPCLAIARWCVKDANEGGLPHIFIQGSKYIIKFSEDVVPGASIPGDVHKTEVDGAGDTHQDVVVVLPLRGGLVSITCDHIAHVHRCLEPDLLVGVGLLIHPLQLSPTKCLIILRGVGRALLGLLDGPLEVATCDNGIEWDVVSKEEEGPCVMALSLFLPLA